MTFDASRLTVELGDAGDNTAWREGWETKPPISVDQWADKHRKLTREGAAEPGDWSTDRTPYLRRIMWVLSDEHPCKKVAFMKPTQVGGTEVLNNFVGYIVHHSPGPTMVVMPTEKLAQRWSNQRLKTMLAASPVLSGIISPSRSRDASNTTLMKEFPGGFLVIAGANSASDLRSMPARRILLDEVDEYPDDLDDQGRPHELAERRASTFVRRKVLLISSPKLKADSVIASSYEDGTQEQYHVPCPVCLYKQPLEIDQLLPDGTYLCCNGACGAIIQEHHKTWMLSEDSGASWVAKFPDRDMPSFRLNALYAPLGLGYTWAEIAEMRDAAERDPEKQVTFTNTILGMPFEGERQKQDPATVEDRAERGAYRGVVPAGRYLLTVGVDCQHDRFAIHTVSFGAGERISVVDYVEIEGDPSKQEGYAGLEEWLKRTYPNSRGVQILPSVVAIDGGNWTEEVAKFVRRQGQLTGSMAKRTLQVGKEYRNQSVLLVRGRSAKSERVVYRPSKTETNQKGKTIARSVGVWGVGTDVAKNILMGRIGGDAGAESVEDLMIRFPGGREKIDIADHAAESTYLPRSFYDGLTVEWFDLGAKKWVCPRNARNEPLDTLVYAYFAALSPAMRIDLKRDSEWAQLKKQLEPEIDLFSNTNDDVQKELIETPVGDQREFAKERAPHSKPSYRRGTRSRGVS